MIVLYRAMALSMNLGVSEHPQITPIFKCWIFLPSYFLERMKLGTSSAAYRLILASINLCMIEHHPELACPMSRDFWKRHNRDN